MCPAFCIGQYINHLHALGQGGTMAGANMRGTVNRPPHNRPNLPSHHPALRLNEKSGVREPCRGGSHGGRAAPAPTRHSGVFIALRTPTPYAPAHRGLMCPAYYVNRFSSGRGRAAPPRSEKTKNRYPMSKPA